MNADWYVDPLGRYEGRFWDGEQWTDQVKDQGRLVTDPDWPPVLPSERPDVDVDDSLAAEPATDDVPTSDGDAPVSAGSEVGDLEPSATELAPAVSAASADDDPDTPDFESADDSAVAPVTTEIRRIDGIDFSSESPTRQVAVLGEVPSEPQLPADSIAASGDEADRRSSRRWLYLIGAAVLVAGLLLALLPRVLGDDDEGASDDTTELDDPRGAELPATDPDADADDAESTDESDDAAASPSDDASTTDDDAGQGDESDTADRPADDSAGADAAADEATDDGVSIQAGALRIANGRAVLSELDEWHADQRESRGIAATDGGGCWLGAIGEAVVQNAQCGPVGATADGEPLFDLVPLRFADVDDGAVEVTPIVDAVVTETVLPTGLELIDAEGERIDPADAFGDLDASEASSSGSTDGSSDESPNYNDAVQGGAGGEDNERGGRGERTDGDG